MSEKVDSAEIDEAIRGFLKSVSSPRTMEEICEQVADELGCWLTDVEQRVRELPDVERGGRLYQLSDDGDENGS